MCWPICTRKDYRLTILGHSLTLLSPFDTLVSHYQELQASTSPSTRLLLSPDYGHMWHPENFETQFTNGTLTIAVNGLSLDKDWVDPKRLTLWALLNYLGLL